MTSLTTIGEEPKDSSGWPENMANHENGDIRHQWGVYFMLIPLCQITNPTLPHRKHHPKWFIGEEGQNFKGQDLVDSEESYWLLPQDEFRMNIPSSNLVKVIVPKIWSCAILWENYFGIVYINESIRTTRRCFQTNGTTLMLMLHLDFIDWYQFHMDTVILFYPALRTTWQYCMDFGPITSSHSLVIITPAVVKLVLGLHSWAIERNSFHQKQ